MEIDFNLGIICSFILYEVAVMSVLCTYCLDILVDSGFF